MINSTQMARTKGRQARPGGDKITVGPEERAKFKELRNARGWRQQDLAAKVGVTPATISNLESGRHPQIYRAVYTKLRAALLRDDAAAGPDYYKIIVEGAVDLTESDQRAVAALIDTLKRTRTES